MYLRDENRNPVGCIAMMKLCNSDKRPTVMYNFSASHPKDKFNRALARKIAASRLEMMPLYVECDASSAHTITKAVMTHLIETTGSMRAGNSALIWLLSNEKNKASEVNGN